MIKIKPILITVCLLILVSCLASAIQYEPSSPSLEFKDDEEKIIAIQTETEPLLISYSLSKSLSKFIDITTSGDPPKVSKDQSLILTVHAAKPAQKIEGHIIINSIYEKLPDIEEFSDDTILITVIINSNEE